MEFDLATALNSNSKKPAGTGQVRDARHGPSKAQGPPEAGAPRKPRHGNGSSSDSSSSSSSSSSDSDAEGKVKGCPGQGRPRWGSALGGAGPRTAWTSPLPPAAHSATLRAPSSTKPPRARPRNSR
ncbi:Hypothetical predicted protein [Marmota monax]|uniref:Uncharacterized protein n=1 Tax=Marmota monax TaxID=9995 RepID=A0A5E4AHI4_MARMO|nr:hypothetical protein GHT09_016135 [Marmota monax]VTJ56176.1 Hypothetical predicted protein [Marmota monax]